LFRLCPGEVCPERAERLRRLSSRRGRPRQDGPGAEPELVVVLRVQEDRGLTRCLLRPCGAPRPELAVRFLDLAARLADSLALGVVHATGLRQAFEAGGGPVAVTVDRAGTRDADRRLDRRLCISGAGLLAMVLLVEQARLEELVVPGPGRHHR